MIDEKCMTVICHGQLYQQRITCAFNKKIHPNHFEEGDLVLMKRNTTLPKPRGKFSYKGPYVVKKAFLEGALILADMDGEKFQMPMNSDNVIRYYAWRCSFCQKKNGGLKTQKGGLCKRRAKKF